jgi:hypothetical protein
MKWYGNAKDSIFCGAAWQAARRLLTGAICALANPPPAASLPHTK